MRKEVLFLLIISIVLSACVKETVYIPECDSKDEQGKRDICYNNEAVLNHDFRYCDKIESKEKQDSCIMFVEKAVGPRPKDGWFN